MTKFIVKRPIRFGDCDPGGVVYTPKVGYFVIEAVMDFLADRLSGPAEKRILEMGILPPARALSIDFLNPMPWGEELEIHVSVKEIRTHAIVYVVEGKIHEKKSFTAELTQVCTSPETKVSVKIPDILRKALSEM